MVIDEHGRLFGRVNLIDFAAGLFCLVLIPLGYGAFVLFRTPTPQITSVEPTTLIPAENSRITIRGSNFRPYLRARIGPSIEGVFLAESPTVAEIKIVSRLAPGVYDVSLYDEANEVFKLPNGLTFAVPPAALAGTFVQLIGEFPALTPEQAKKLTVGTNLFDGAAPSFAEVAAVRAPEAAVVRIKTLSGVLDRPVSDRVRIAAVLRARCTVVGDECKVGDTTVAVNTTVTLPVGGAPSAFRIDRVAAPEEPPVFSPQVTRRSATVDVRFWVFPGVETLIVNGVSDRDSRVTGTGTQRAAAQVLSFRKAGEVEAQAGVDAAGPDSRGQSQMFGVTQRLAMIEATLAVPVEQVPDGWAYKGLTLKVGAPFVFEGPMYTMRGWILRLNVPDDANPARGAGPKGRT